MVIKMTVTHNTTGNRYKWMNKDLNLTITFTFRAFSRYNKYICQKKEKQQSIADGTVRMFTEPSAEH